MHASSQQPNPAPVKFSAVIPAAGSGTRMNAKVRKPFLKLAGRPLVLHTVMRFSLARGCQNIVLAVHPDDLQVYRSWEDLLSIAPDRITIIAGGRTRQESVRNAIRETPDDHPHVLIHDAARPLVRLETIERVAVTTMAHGAAIAAISARETIKRTGDDGWIEETLDRSKLWMTHTPQGFERDIILDAHRSALEDNICATDDSALVERSGCRVKIVRSHPDNIKITTPEDLEIAETLLRWQREHNLPEALAIY